MPLLFEIFKLVDIVRSSHYHVQYIMCPCCFLHFIFASAVSVLNSGEQRYIKVISKSVRITKDVESLVIRYNVST